MSPQDGAAETVARMVRPPGGLHMEGGGEGVGICAHIIRAAFPHLLQRGQGLRLPGAQRAVGTLPTTPREHAHMKPVLQPPRTHLLCDVIVTRVNAVPEQVLSAAITATEVAAMHELPVGRREVG